MMTYLSKAALALTLATATPLAMAMAKADLADFADFAADANSSSFFNGGKTRVIVGYNDDMAAGSFAIKLQSIDGNGNGQVNFQEVSNRKFKIPQEVVLPDVDSMSITEDEDEDGWGWVQEGAMSTGYSVLEFESSDADVNAQMGMLSSVLRDIPGVVSVEKDGVMHALPLSTQKQKHLRDGEAAAAAAVDLNLMPMQVQDSQEVIKASSGQITETGDEAKHAGRRLVDSIPYGIDMVASAYVNAKPDPVDAQPITICVVDTGYDLGHLDLPNTSHGVDGYSPYANFGQVWNVDGQGHGTHCAGTIGAIGVNGIGITSVNPDPTKFKFYIGKGLTDSGSGSDSFVMDSIDKCVDNGAKVISMSLGSSVFSTAFNNLMKDHYDNGVLFIAAAGNGGSSAPLSYPASYKTVVSVAAVDINEDRASFSETNNQVELSGPGVDVWSTYPGNYLKSLSGTSMACPHVAGVAALIWYHFPDCTNNQIRNVLILSSKDLGASSWDSSYGWGLVNATTAYNLLESQGCEAGGPRDYGRPLHEVALGGEDQLSMLPSSVPSLSPSSSLGTSSSPSEMPSSQPSESPSDVPSSSSVTSAHPSGLSSSQPSESPSDVPSASSSYSLAPSQSPTSSLSPTASTSPSTSSEDCGCQFDHSCFPADGVLLKEAADAFCAGEWDSSHPHYAAYGPIEEWCTELVTTMRQLFSLKVDFNADISRWITASVTDMSEMFDQARHFQQNLSSWDVSSVSNMARMFRYASVFNGSIENWNVSSVTDMSGMFEQARHFQQQDLSSWDVSSVSNMARMFHVASVFNGSIENWNVSSVTDMSWMFSFAQAMKQDLTSWDVSSVTNMFFMFNHAISFTGGGIGAWNTASVTSMDGMFNGARSFDDDSIQNWDVSAVNDMTTMFSMASSFRGNGIGNWDVSSVTTMTHMFYGSRSLIGDLSRWDLSSVTDTRYMFRSAVSFTGEGIGDWNVSSVTTMRGMFFYHDTFTGSNIGSWDVSSVSDMGYMFNRASAFSIGSIENWDVSAVTDMGYMFWSASSFTGNIGGWNVSKVRNMAGMFLDANSFTGEAIAAWDVSKVTNMARMFHGASSFTGEGIDQWEIASVTNMNQMLLPSILASGI